MANSTNIFSIKDINKTNKVPKNKISKNCLRLLWQKLCIFNARQVNKTE